MGLSLKPLADRVVVEPAPAEDKSAGGIILPDTAHIGQLCPCYSFDSYIIDITR